MPPCNTDLLHLLELNPVLASQNEMEIQYPNTQRYIDTSTHVLIYFYSYVGTIAFDFICAHMSNSAKP